MDPAAGKHVPSRFYTGTTSIIANACAERCATPRLKLERASFFDTVHSQWRASQPQCPGPCPYLSPLGSLATMQHQIFHKVYVRSTDNQWNFPGMCFALQTSPVMPPTVSAPLALRINGPYARASA